MAINWSTARLQTAAGIAYMLVDGPTFDHDENGTTASETYLMQAGNIAAFVAESTPPPYILGNRVWLPARRRMPGAPFLVTKSIHMQPHTGQIPGDPLAYDSSAPAGTYDPEYLVTIKYTTGKESDATERDPEAPDTFLEYSMQVGGEFYPIDKSLVRYAEDGDESGAPVGHGLSITDSKDVPGLMMSVATIEHNLRWSHVLDPKWTTIIDMLGKVNSGDISQLFDNDPADETMLFSSVSGTQKYVWDGASARTQPWQIDYKFSQRCKTFKHETEVDEDGNPTDVAVTWNHCWSSMATKWVRPFWIINPLQAVVPGSATPNCRFMYETADLMDLFKV